MRRELNLLYYLSAAAGFYSISTLTEVPPTSGKAGGSVTTTSVFGLRKTDVFLSVMILGLVTLSRLLELESLGLGEVSSYFTVMRMMSF